MKYRKKPIIIEAFQYDGDLMNEHGEYYVPQWAINAFKEGTLFYNPYELYIKTLEGDMLCGVGDYIIQGVNGELYPCKEDIFNKTYERVVE